MIYMIYLWGIVCAVAIYVFVFAVALYGRTKYREGLRHGYYQARKWAEQARNIEARGWQNNQGQQPEESESWPPRWP